jgi:hypothetical protein
MKKKRIITFPIYDNNSKITGIKISGSVIKEINTEECPKGGAHKWELNDEQGRPILRCKKCGKEDGGK